jgi:hypothetical protein
VWVPLIVLAIGLIPVRFGYIFATYGWLHADAIWTSFPVTSLSILRWPLDSIFTAGGGRRA